MKKLMILSAALVAAVAAHAVEIKWSATGQLFDGRESPALVSSQPKVYLMVWYNKFGSKDTILNAFVAANGNVDATVAAMRNSGWLATGEGIINSSSQLETTSSEFANWRDDKTNYSVYGVILEDKRLCFTWSATATLDEETGIATADLGPLNNLTQTIDATLAVSSGRGYSADAWYVIPEPTTGLLVLLGLAGLALRRKQK